MICHGGDWQVTKPNLMIEIVSFVSFRGCHSFWYTIPVTSVGRHLVQNRGRNIQIVIGSVFCFCSRHFNIFNPTVGI